GKPLLRPRMVTSPLKPIGMPATSRNFRIGLKSRTRVGTCPLVATATFSMRALICVAPFLASSCVGSFRRYTGDTQEGADVTAARRTPEGRPKDAPRAAEGGAPPPRHRGETHFPKPLRIREYVDRDNPPTRDRQGQDRIWTSIGRPGNAPRYPVHEDTRR